MRSTNKRFSQSPNGMLLLIPVMQVREKGRKGGITSTVLSSNSAVIKILAQYTAKFGYSTK